MIEQIFLEYLNNTLDCGVYMMRPQEEPERYVLIEKTGSSKVNHIPTAVLAFQSYGPTLYDAAVLNEQVKTAVEDSIYLSSVSNVTLNSDYNFTDTATKQPRYQAIYEVVYF